ncbi:MAG: uracil-DNA glycosylase [bacterium]
MGDKQAAYLDAMGITRWVRRVIPETQEVQQALVSPVSQVSEAVEVANVTDQSAASVSPASTSTSPPPSATPSSSAIASPSLPPTPSPDKKESKPAIDTPYQKTTAEVPLAPGGLPLSEMGWRGLQSAVSQCTACSLAQGRTQTVFGTGNERADWLVIGEAPGQQEDLQGLPFVGRAGLLLNNMLMAMGLEREAVYIANVVKCRPPQNRDPRPDEIDACKGYLARQVQLLKPRLVLVVGRVAAQHLLETQAPVGKLRGQVHRYPGTDIPLIVTYHPAYLLRKPSEKYKSWEDLQLAMSAFNASPDQAS